MTNRIVTHSGKFHADDVFCAAVLWELFTTYITRTRDPEIIKSAMANPKDIVFDVGGDYDEAKGNFDHHQAGGAGVRPNGVPYSSFGLIWKSYGFAFVLEALKGQEPKDAVAAKVADEVERALVEVVDAVDNGATEGGLHLKGKPESRIRGANISLLIHQFNPVTVPGKVPTERDFDAEFVEARKFAHRILENAVNHAYAAIAAKELVVETVAAQAGNNILVFERYCDWQSNWSEIPKNVLFCCYPSTDGNWMVQQVPVAKFSPEGRLPLPAAWAGKKDKELQDITGVPGATFCHNGRFICGAKTMEDAFTLADLAAKGKTGLKVLEEAK